MHELWRKWNCFMFQTTVEAKRWTWNISRVNNVQICMYVLGECLLNLLENLTRRNYKSELVLELSIVFFSVSEIDFWAKTFQFYVFTTISLSSIPHDPFAIRWEFRSLGLDFVIVCPYVHCISINENHLLLFSFAVLWEPFSILL